MPSTHKNVIVRKRGRDSVSGYVSPANFVVEGKLELLNPAGKVPVLVRRRADGSPDFVLTQSNAILMFAADWARGRLLPHDSQARVKALEAWFYFVTDVIALNGVAFALKGEGYSEASQRLIDWHLTRIADS